jgi:hypothetical protein
MNILSASLLSLASIFIVQFFIEKLHFNAVRASSLSIVMFALLLFFLRIEEANSMLAVFFGASFIGMSDRTKVSRKQISFAAIIFAIIYCYFLPKDLFLGGSLGASAFISCFISVTILKSSKLIYRGFKGPCK